MTVDWQPVLAEHRANNGFVEGPNNGNPWGPEQGVRNAAYCASASSIVAYHHGVRWPADSQFGEKGFAYSPYFRAIGLRHGFWKDGHDVDLSPGDIVCDSWRNNGVADHTETVIAVYADGTYDSAGYNTGNPEGCHVPIRRDRKYLLGRWRMEGNYYGIIPGPGGHVDAPYSFHTTVPDFVDWPALDGHSWLLTKDGATYASPGSPAVPGVNGQSYFAGRQAAKLHVQVENGVYVSTVESSDARLYRPDGGPPFRTH